jgi:hypothetical protein
MTPRIRSVFVVSPAGSSFGFLSLSSAAPDFSPPDCDFLLPACRQVRFPASAEAARPGQSLTDFLPPIFAVFIQASVFVSVPSSAGVLHYSLFCSPQWISSYRLLFPRVIHFSRLILSCAGSCSRYRFPGPAWRVHCRCTCLQRARAASTLSLCEDFCRPCSSWFSFWPGLLLACERGIDLCS